MIPLKNSPEPVGPSCCAGGSRHTSSTTAVPVAVDPSASARGIHRDVRVSAGWFAMGDAFGEGYPGDGESPVHQVRVDSFSIDTTTVTNAMYAAFVADSGYRTEAEQFGSSAVFHLLSTARRDDVLGAATGAPWWLNIRGADWAHPTGPESRWQDIADHPVVHISHNDALAYCQWAGRRLPTEAEWEYAARGGLQGARYAWGNELTPGRKHQCNIWQGDFPRNNTTEDRHLGTAPVKSFPANGYGLYEVAGNVWEWCSDWFLPKYYRNSPAENPQGPTIGAGRVMRGGSYLCHDSYCNRYRVAARTSNTPESSSGNCGFRTVAL
ncbi:formylglycine-generating enzyme family protein [Paenarthrobacter sp. NPDC089322]|uniref:formylglycine-generating enzyme family protein n=1 Tax=Paenarthrobacter sp. NPDC089322 TaxID=3155065 RepID=UPI00343E405F